MAARKRRTVSKSKAKKQGKPPAQAPRSGKSPKPARALSPPPRKRPRAGASAPSKTSKKGAKPRRGSVAKTKPTKKRLSQSESAVRARVYRREKKIRERELALDRRERALKGWDTRRVREARELLVGGLDGKTKEDLYVLRRMIEDGDVRWNRYLKFAEDMGKSERQAKNEWFSPKAKKK